MSYYQSAKLQASALCSRSTKCNSGLTRVRGEPVADAAARCSVELRPVGGHPSGGYEVPRYAPPAPYYLLLPTTTCCYLLLPTLLPTTTYYYLTTT